jgi:hypothetical protein
MPAAAAPARSPAPGDDRRPELAPDIAADQIGTMTTRKFVVPAFIDPPSSYAPIEEWLAYRDDLARLDVPGLASFIREATANIARLRRATGESAARRPEERRARDRTGDKTGPGVGRREGRTVLSDLGAPAAEGLSPKCLSWTTRSLA